MVALTKWWKFKQKIKNNFRVIKWRYGDEMITNYKMKPFQGVKIE